MQAFLVKRLSLMVIVLLLVTLITHLMIVMAPGDPAILILGDQATQEQIDRLHREMGLDRPQYVQIALWYSRVFRGDLGNSIFHGQPVLPLVLSRIEPSLLVSFLGTATAIILGVPLGVLAAVKRGTIADRFVAAVSVLGMSVPTFFLALVLILLFSIYLRWTPVSGYVPLSENPLQTLRSLILPIVAVGISQAAWVARVSRSSMLEVLLQDYVRTARAKGLNRGNVLSHALRNALLPIVTVVGIITVNLFSAAIIIEVIFRIPGIGSLVVDAVIRRDYPIVQGTLIFAAFAYAFVNLIVDILYVYLDPRVKYE